MGKNVLLLKSIYAATIHLIGITFGRGNISAFASRFRKFISDESIVAMAIGHFELVRTMNQRGALTLTKRYPNYVFKYFDSYLVRSFTRKTRRELLKFHHQYLMEHVAETFYEQILESGSIL